MSIQTLFRSLLDSLHECWYLNEQHPGSYSPAFVKLLKKYHKISWEEECDMVMDATYFEYLNEAKTPVPKSIYYTHQLHMILCELPKHWEAFVFSYTLKDKQKVETTFNEYGKLYKELAMKPKKD